MHAMEAAEDDTSKWATLYAGWLATQLTQLTMGVHYPDPGEIQSL